MNKKRSRNPFASNGFKRIPEANVKETTPIILRNMLLFYALARETEKRKTLYFNSKNSFIST